MKMMMMVLGYIYQYTKIASKNYKNQSNNHSGGTIDVNLI